MRRGFLLGAVLLWGCSDNPVTPAKMQPVVRRSIFADTTASYIVVLERGNSAEAFEHANNLKATSKWSRVLNGLAVKLSPAQAEKLSENPTVKSIELNQEVRVFETWGQDRTDQRYLPLDSSYTTDRTGEGVTAYIIDTGIRETHTEFEGRVTGSVDFTGDSSCLHFHGTHVAGTVGGKTYGIAKRVSLFSVRVLNCSGAGTYEQVISGIEYVTANAHKPAVANMSLGGGFSQAVNDAVEASIASGVSYSVAAGNSTGDACDFSPASSPNALTVAASDPSDLRASFSNFGRCVDLYAPGVSVLSAWNTDDNATGYASGTSMAAPHVAGVIALYLQGRPDALPKEVSDSVLAYSTKAVIDGRNPLLFSGRIVDSTPTPPPLPPPAAPTNLTATAWAPADSVSGWQMWMFQWKDNSTNEYGFVIVGQSDTNYQLSGSGPANSLNIGVFMPPGKWTVRVRSFNDGGFSSYASVTFCFSGGGYLCAPPPPPPDTVVPPPDTTTPPPAKCPKGWRRQGRC